jgi:hypothetical protein
MTRGDQGIVGNVVEERCDEVKEKEIRTVEMD